MLGNEFLVNTVVSAMDDSNNYVIQRTRLHVAIMHNDTENFQLLIRF